MHAHELWDLVESSSSQGLGLECQPLRDSADTAVAALTKDFDLGTVREEVRQIVVERGRTAGETREKADEVGATSLGWAQGMSGPAAQRRLVPSTLCTGIATTCNASALVVRLPMTRELGVSVRRRADHSAKSVLATRQQRHTNEELLCRRADPPARDPVTPWAYRAQMASDRPRVRVGVAVAEPRARHKLVQSGP